MEKLCAPETGFPAYYVSGINRAEIITVDHGIDNGTEVVKFERELKLNGTIAQ